MDSILDSIPEFILECTSVGFHFGIQVDWAPKQEGAEISVVPQFNSRLSRELGRSTQPIPLAQQGRHQAGSSSEPHAGSAPSCLVAPFGEHGSLIHPQEFGCHFGFQLGIHFGFHVGLQSLESNLDGILDSNSWNPTWIPFWNPF